MELYDSHEDMEREEYRPARDDRSMQAAWAVILDPRPRVQELGNVSLDTVRKVLFTLHALEYEAPEDFTLGRDDLLLYVIIGEKRSRLTSSLVEVLNALNVYLGEGAYYLVIDTSAKPPKLHAGAHLEEGLDTALTIAALVREQAALESEGKA